MDFNEYQEKTKDTWISNDKDLERVVLGICGESGEIAEFFKKFYREDKDSETATLDYNGLRKEIGDTLYYLAMLCNIMGMSLKDVAQINIKKLADRQKRGKLKGSGDKR